MHPAAQIPVAGGELAGLEPSGLTQHQGGAALLLGALLQPYQPSTPEFGLLDRWDAPLHQRGGQGALLQVGPCRAPQGWLQYWAQLIVQRLVQRGVQGEFKGELKSVLFSLAA